jgi:predicted metal-dependent hydrolase
MRAQSIRLRYGDGVIKFTLRRRDRKTLSISVNPELGVGVSAPVNASLVKIMDKVRARARWIQSQLQFFSQFHPRTPQRRYVAGETHLYLGRQYKLKVAYHLRQDVKLYRGCLLVQSRRPKDTDVTKGLVEGWYCERARVKFRERLSICQKGFPRPEDHEPTGLVIRRLQQRWGSMTADGKLVLNRSLIQSSVDAIDYVITHELCHLLHEDHGQMFYRLLDRVMPDWERRKTKLERQLA